MLNNVLFFCRKNCNYSKKLSTFLKSRSKKITIVPLKINERPKNKKILNKYYDYIFSFRSTYILNKNLINKTSKASINFHPGPPEFRGIGCINYALYKNSNFYGVTAHTITTNIDKGIIIDVKKFKISKKINLKKILDKTHKLSFVQAKKIIKNLSLNEKNLNKMIFNNKSFKWSKILTTRKYLNNFYRINKNITKKDLNNKLRATLYKNYKPFIILHGKKFEYKER